MTYQEFIDLIKNKAHDELSYDFDMMDFFPEGYTSNDPQIIEWIIDSNSRYVEGETAPWLQTDLLVLKKPQGDNVITAQRIAIRELYKDAEENGFDFAFDKIRQVNTDVISSEMYSNAINARAANDYTKIREQLIIRPLNYSLHMSELGGCVYQKFSDFVLVLYQLIGRAKGTLTSSKIKRLEVKNWNMSEETVMKCAMENSMRLFPPCVYDNRKQQEVNFLTEEFSREDITFKSPFGGKDTILLSTIGTTNGAVALFYPGVVDKMMQIMNGSFLAVFMNINDVMILDRKDVDTGRQFAHTAKATSKLGEMLSGKLYLCDENGISIM